MTEDRPFFALLNELIHAGFDYSYKEMEYGSDSHIAMIESKHIVIWFGEEAWSVSDHHKPHPRLCGAVCADVKPFDKLSLCPVQVKLPETVEQIDELVGLMVYIESREGRKWLSEYPEVKYEHLEDNG